MLRAAAAEVAAQQATARLAGAAASLSGIFAVDKPPGISCTGVLDYFKRNVGRGAAGVPFAEHFERERDLRRTGEKIRRRRCSLALRVGHGGTLDVEAAGVLVVGIGRGCKLLGGYLAGGKAYLATARLGAATDSCDAEGRIVSVASAAAVTGAALQAAIPRFVGRIQQRPPLYSAIKVDGKRLYEYARGRGGSGGASAPPAIEPRWVDVGSIKLLCFENPALAQCVGRRVALPAQYADYYAGGRYRWSAGAGEVRVGAPMAPFANCPHLPHFQMLVRCGGGVYVRSLVHDLGAAVGSAAAMVSLVRMSQGPLLLGRDTVGVDDLPHIDRVVEAMRHANATIERAASHGPSTTATATATADS
ncbi:pseudouridine synthase pus4 [Coemansia javaensis]|uniref:tRNA pseudouridine(55) synthase n=1 Tax=Coemansia javaensis TaxID=2761396 RepID=A0A9W8HDJ2_9FUNG|nr:pseudouridine synthase pus4 [Coemansia javaensis]